MQRKNIFHKNGSSVIAGVDYGEYPIHKFRTFSIVDNIYPLYIESSGDDLWHCECRRQRKNSDIFSVEYVEEGVFVFNRGDEIIECHPGEIFLLHPGSDSSMRCKSVTARKKVAIIRGNALPGILQASGLDRVSHIKIADSAAIDRIFAEIYSLKESDTGRKNSMLCYDLLLTMAEQAVLSPRPPELQKCLNFIQNSLDFSITLEQLAQHGGISKATLNRLFQEFFQCSPMAYYRKLRMEKARHLLKYHPVKVVAGMMSFSSSQYFAGEFKKIFGIQPKKCRHEQ